MAAPHGGVEVDGLAELVKATRRLDRAAPKRFVAVLRDATKRVQSNARGRAHSTSRSAPTRTSWIGRGTTQRGGSLNLLGSKDRRAWATEWGMRRAYVFGRRTLQTRLRRRQFAPWRGNQFVVRGSSGPGWVIQAAIRDQLPDEEKRLNAELYAVWSDVLTAAGVPRG